MNAKLALFVVVAYIGATLVSTERTDKLSCPICKRLAALIKPNLEDPKAVEQIRQIIDQACAQAPPGEQDKCKSTLNGYVELLHDLSPPEFCKKIGACTSDSLSRLITGDSDEFGRFLIDTMEPINEQLVQGSSQQCTICRQVAKQLIETLKKESVKKSIIDGVGKVCAIASKDPAKVKECAQVLAGYTEQLIESIVEQDPAVICTILGQCEYLFRSSDPKICEMCEKAINDLKKQLLDPNMISQVQKMLDNICAAEADSAACKKQWFERIVKLVNGIKAIKPIEVCQEASFCP